MIIYIYTDNTMSGSSNEEEASKTKQELGKRD